jgi:ribonuclease HI
MKLLVHLDGGSRGNPGPAACGVYIRDRDTDSVVHQAGYFLGRTTNNVAEYTGLIRALGIARDLGAADVEVRSDSELMVRQLSGQYKVKSSDLKPLFEQARGLLAGFHRTSVQHVYRAKNAEADELANLAMDKSADVVLVDRGKRLQEPAMAAGAGEAPTVPCFSVTLAGKPRQCLVGQSPGNPYTFGPTTPEGFCVHAAAAALADCPLQWPPSRRSGGARCVACAALIRITRLT